MLILLLNKGKIKLTFCSFPFFLSKKETSKPKRHHYPAKTLLRILNQHMVQIKNCNLITRICVFLILCSFYLFIFYNTIDPKCFLWWYILNYFAVLVFTHRTTFSINLKIQTVCFLKYCDLTFMWNLKGKKYTENRLVVASGVGR